MNTTVTLNDGNKMPIMGLGTWQSPKDQVYAAVKAAVKAGYRHIDCALIYGNEPEIGKALKELFEEGVVKREDLWVTTKLWNAYHSKEAAPKSIAQSLENLGLDYVDLYLIHWPVGFEENTDLFPRNEDGSVKCSDVDYIETYKCLEEFQKMGYCRSIGVSNFNSVQIKRVIETCSVVPAVNQVECHPFLNQEKLRDFCAQHKIVLTAYSPLGSPASSFHSGREEEPVLKNAVIGEIATKHGKTPAQVCIRFQIQRGLIVIPKTVTEARIIDNANVWDFELSQEDMQALMELGKKNSRFCTVQHFKHSKYWPFSVEF